MSQRRESRPPTRMSPRNLVMNNKMTDLQMQQESPISSLSRETRYSILMDHWCNLMYGLQNDLIGRDEVNESSQYLMKKLNIPFENGFAYLSVFRSQLKKDKVDRLQLENGLVLNIE